MADLSYIHPQLQPFAVPIANLKLDPKNARKHDERNLSAIGKSLSQFGQRLPIVVQKQGNVIRAGNGRVTAARKLGWTHIAAVVVDESEAESVAFALADNRTADLAEWDTFNLSEILATLGNYTDLIESTGFSDREIHALLKQTQDVSIEDTMGASGTGTGTGEIDLSGFSSGETYKHHCPKCGFGYNLDKTGE